jgi:hypothetical protein
MITDEQIAEAQTVAAIVLERLMAVTKKDGSVHLESLSAAIGALAGRGCQLAALEGVASGNPDYLGRTLTTSRGLDGEEYYVGDAMNVPLAESETSVWRFVGGSAQFLGATLPSLGEIHQHSSTSMGSSAFGIPRYAPGTSANESPRDYLRYWGPLFDTVKTAAASPQQWPVVYALACHQLFGMTAGQYDLGVLTRIIMDSAYATALLKLRL